MPPSYKPLLFLQREPCREWDEHDPVFRERELQPDAGAFLQPEILADEAGQDDTAFFIQNYSTGELLRATANRSAASEHPHQLFLLSCCHLIAIIGEGTI